MVTVQGMYLRDLLPQYGIPSIAALRQRLGLTKQYAWLLWHGKIALSSDMLRRLHGELDIPLDVLLKVERAEPAKRRGRKPLRPRPAPPARLAPDHPACPQGGRQIAPEKPRPAAPPSTLPG